MSFPDAVQLMVETFNGVNGYRAFAEFPPKHDHETPSIEIVDAGGPGIVNHVYDAQRVTFFVENPSRSAARDMCLQIRDHLHNHMGGVWYWIADTSNVYYYPDPAVGQHRYAYTARINTKQQ